MFHSYCECGSNDDDLSILVEGHEITWECTQKWNK